MLKIKTLCFIIAIFAGYAMILSCNKSTIDTYNCDGVVATYDGNVKALLNANCATGGCHDAGSKQKGIDLSNYTSAKAEAQSDAFLGSIQHKRGFEKMPDGKSKLDDATIKTISCWVQNNCPQN